MVSKWKKGVEKCGGEECGELEHPQTGTSLRIAGEGDSIWHQLCKDPTLWLVRIQMWHAKEKGKGDQWGQNRSSFSVALVDWLDADPQVGFVQDYTD